MKEETKSKAMNVLDTVGGFIPYMITLEFPLCFAMLVTFIVKMAGRESDFMTALGFFCCFGLPIMWASSAKIVFKRLNESQSKWKIPFAILTAICLVFALVFGVILANRFDVIISKL